MSPDSWQDIGSDRIKKMWDDMYYGNGKPGLVTRVNDVEKDIRLILEREEKRSRKLDRIELAVWVAVITAVVTIITSHIH